MSFLLDTNIISHLIRNPHGIVNARIAMLGEPQVMTSVIVAAELRFGAEKSESQVLTAKVEQALGRMIVLPFDPPTDSTYARVRAQLERAGAPICANDMLIAAQALALDLTVVTDNVREFIRVDGLRVENWIPAD